MRLIAVLLMVSASTLWAKVSAQEVKLDLRIENKTLVELMDLLKAESGILFVYSAEDVEAVKEISIEVQDKSIREILDIALQGTGLTYSLENNLVILRRQAEQPQTRQPQRRVLTGIVTGQNPKDTLAGVSVTIKGTTMGVVTDIHGKYSLPIPDVENVTICFSFIGKTPQEVKYAGQKTLDIKLADSSEELEEVVINAGYLQIDKRKSTTSVTTLKMDDIMMPGVRTLDQMLEGHVPGMIFMQNSGQVGAAPRLRVRGTSTVLGSQEPLWVIDGIIQEDPVNVDPAQLNDLDFVNLLGNAISGLNPEDIEQIDVLKDAAATALYGTRAANGVIVITTKQGKAGPPMVRYSFGGTFSRRPRYSDRSMDVMNSAERVAFSRELLEKKMAYPDKNSWIGYEKAYEDYRNGILSPAEFQEATSYYETLNTDWLDAIYRDSFSHNHTLSFSGGSQNAKYYASVGYNRTNGVLQKESGDRYTANMNVTLNFDRFKAQFRLGGNVQEQKHTPQDVGLADYAHNMSRAIPLYNEDGSLFFYPKKGGTAGLQSYFNVLNERDNSYQNIDKNSLNFSAQLDYTIIDNLKLSGTFSYGISNTKDEIYHGAETHYALALAKKAWNASETYLNSTSWSMNTLLPYGGELKRSETRNQNYMARLQANYNLYLDENQNNVMQIMAGAEVSSSNYTGLDKTFRCYEPERGLSVGNVDASKYAEYVNWLTSDKNALGILKDNLNNMVSAYASLSYSYKDLYILNGNMRVDYSNKFGDRSREKFLPIWSLSGRWNAKEDVLENVHWVNELALKASFGYQGSAHSTQSPNLQLNKGELDLAFNEYSATIKSFPNPDLAWEKTMNVNASLDFSLFNNKLNGSLSYFYKKTTDAFLNKKVALVNGVASYAVNQGTVENQGVEVSLNINPFNSAMGGNRKGFSWRIDPQLGQVVNRLINKVLETDKPDPLHDEYTYMDFLNGNAHVSGKPLNSFYSYEFTGLSAKDGRPTFARVGEEYFADYVDMPKADVYTSVMKYSGCRVPYLQGGINNTFQWNGFVLSFNLSYSIGSKIRLLKLYDPKASSSAVAPVQNLRREMTKRWQTTGDERYTNIPGLLPKAEYDETLSPWWKGEPYAFAENIWEMYNFADIRVVSGNYLKLQSLNLRYVFSDEVCKRLNLSSLYLSLSGTNLFTWSAKALKGQDPASQSGSASRINVAPPSTYTLSVNIAF